jgi:hypothetical protein
MPKRRLPPDEFQLVVRTIANSDRWGVLHQIYPRLAVTTGHIAGALKIPPGRVLHHVRRLERAGLVQGETEGRVWHWMARQDRWRAFLEDVIG